MEQLSFRTTKQQRRLVDQLIALRAQTTGDGSMTGWFREIIQREALHAGLLKANQALQAAPLGGARLAR